MARKTKLHLDPTKTTSIGLGRYSCEFLEAALAADSTMGRRNGFEIFAPIPVLFLVGQSIELALKAFLLSRGVPLENLKSECGHQLHISIRKAKELGLLEIVDLTREEVSTIEVLDRLYSSKQLQYIVTGLKEFPIFGPLQRAALRLVHAICNDIGFAPRHLPQPPV